MGTRLPLVPKFKASAVARYEFPLSGMWDAHVQGALSHVGRRRSDLRTFENALKGMVDAYTTADFSVGVDNGTYRIELFATNLFDSNGVLYSGVQCLETTCGDPDGLSGTGGGVFDVALTPRSVAVKDGLEV